MPDKVQVEDNRGWFKKITDAVNPAYHIAEAVNPRATQASERERVAGGDPKKAEHFNQEHYKFAKSADVELSHNGSFGRGLTQGFVDGLSGGQFAGDPDFRKFHRDVGTIEANGGSYAEYSKFKAAAGDPTKAVSEGAPKQPKLDVTIPDYAEYCKTTTEKGLHGKEREAVVKDTIHDLQNGKTLKQSTKEIEKGEHPVPRAIPVKETANNETGQQTIPEGRQPHLDAALASAGVKTSQLPPQSQDGTVQGVSEGYRGAGAQVAQTNTVQV